MSSFRFLHAADVHLDSPLRGLSRYEGIPHDEVRDATRAAFDNLIQHAIDERIDFVVIAGDLFDGDWKDIKTGLYFARAMGRLDRAEIPVYILAGNHDAASVLTRSVPWPPNVHRFDDRKPQTHRIEELGVSLHGRSFPKPAVSENMVQVYPEATRDDFNIGVLHTALAGREGHEPYAPCDVHHLQAKHYDYWALGHVHAFEIVCSEPYIVFPGNLQGRSVRETGPKGAVLVEVVDRQIVSVKPVELDVIRWAIVEVDCTDREGEAVRSAIRDALILAHAAGKPGVPIIARIVLTGRSPDGARLRDGIIGLRDDARAIAAAVAPDLWIEKLRVIVEQPAADAEVAPPDELVGLLAEAANDADLAGVLREDLAVFLSAAKASQGEEMEPDDLRASASAGNWSAVLATVVPTLHARLTGAQ